MQILILDTDSAFRESLSSIVQKSGHSVAIAQDLAEAMSYCSPEKCDLVFLDLSFQTEMLSRIKEHNPDMLVVVVSLNPSIESIISVLRQGAFDYLIKPFVTSEPLLEAIERARRSIEAASYQHAYLKRILKTFSELSVSSETIRELGYTNGTTELFYNQYFEDILAIELARSQRCDHSFTIVSIRLNYLLDYMIPETDAEFRNQVEAIVEFLRQRMRRTDVLVRTGVNEFMIILVETPREEGGMIVVETIRQGIAALVPEKISGTGQAEGGLPFDIGTADYPCDGMECQVLMRKARQYS